MCSAVCPAQTRRPPLPAGVQALVDSARARPAEYAADALLRLADCPAVSDPAWKRELLEDAFAAAPNAQYPYKRRFAGEAGGNTREWILGKAFELDVDTLSLQCRAVRGMFALERRRAREMFAGIPPLALAPPDCGNPLVPDLRFFYETLQLLAARDPDLLVSRIRLISSPAELAPAAGAIRSAKLSTDDRRALITAYAEKIAAFARNGESLGFAVRDPELPSQPVALAEAARRDGIVVDGLMRAYRDFLAALLASPRCSGSIESVGASWLEQFNERLRLPGYLVTTELPAIAQEDVQPPAVESRARLQMLYASPKAKQLEARLQHLRTGGGDTALSPDQRAAPDWQAEAEGFLAALDEWTPADGDVAANFHEKAGFYLDLLEIAPDGPASLRVARSAVAFFSDHPIEKSQPIEFLCELRRLLTLARTARPVQPQATGPFEAIGHTTGNGAAIASELAKSRDSVVALYARLN